MRNCLISWLRLRKKKTDDEIEAEEKKLKEAEAMTEIFDKMMELEETMKSIQESINAKGVK